MALTTIYYGEALQGGSDRPFTNSFAITKSDDNFLADANDNPRPIRGLMVATTGTQKLTLIDQADADAVTLTLTAGIVYYMQVKKVWNVGTAGAVHGFI